MAQNDRSRDESAIDLSQPWKPEKLSDELRKKADYWGAQAGHSYVGDCEDEPVAVGECPFCGEALAIGATGGVGHVWLCKHVVFVWEAHNSEYSDAFHPIGPAFRQECMNRKLARALRDGEGPDEVDETVPPPWKLPELFPEIETADLTTSWTLDSSGFIIGLMPEARLPEDHGSEESRVD